MRCCFDACSLQGPLNFRLNGHAVLGKIDFTWNISRVRSLFSKNLNKKCSQKPLLTPVYNDSRLKMEACGKKGAGRGKNLLSFLLKTHLLQTKSKKGGQNCSMICITTLSYSTDRPKKQLWYKKTLSFLIESRKSRA